MNVPDQILYCSVAITLFEKRDFRGSYQVNTIILAKSEILMTFNIFVWRREGRIQFFKFINLQKEKKIVQLQIVHKLQQI